ncbi:MAG: hemerythrin domain-containing protein [Pseudomonadota bacterium]
MTASLLDSAPGFDQPIAVLKHCHGRIRKQIRTMENLAIHLALEGLDFDAQQAANSVLRYFNKAAHHHHEDEEQDLLPMLQSTAIGEDALLLDQVVSDIMNEHRQMNTVWTGLNQQLEAISSGASAVLSPDDVEQFAALYQAHMDKEETHIAPMALRLFSREQMDWLGHAMQTRRGIKPATRNAE